MKIKLISIAMIAALSAGFNASAFDIDDVTMDVERSEFKRGHKMKLRVGAVVRDYMLEQGDITQGEIDAQKLEREATRAELKALKEAGDTEGLAARKEELKAQRDERRAAMREYVDNNEELKAEIDEKKQEYRDKIKERRAERKERRKEQQDDTTEG
jgi:predicted nuclease with TOPRIM domain